MGSGVKGGRGKERRQNREMKEGGREGTEQPTARFCNQHLDGFLSFLTHTRFTILGKHDCMEPWESPGPLNNVL